jgi:CheY-like chemotaxis protein
VLSPVFDAPATSIGQPGAFPRSASPTILVADDDPQSVEIVRRLLGLRHFATLAAHGGEECLRVLAAQPVDLLVLDLEMPRVGGTDVLRTLARACAATPVVLMSAAGEERLRAVALAHPRCSYLTKPVNRLELYRRVESALAPPPVLDGPRRGAA